MGWVSDDAVQHEVDHVGGIVAAVGEHGVAAHERPGRDDAGGILDVHPQLVGVGADQLGDGRHEQLVALGVTAAYAAPPVRIAVVPGGGSGQEQSAVDGISAGLEGNSNITLSTVNPDWYVVCSIIEQTDQVGGTVKVNGTVTIKTGATQHTLALIGDRSASPGGPALQHVDLNRKVAGDVFSLLHWNTVPLGGKFVGMRLNPPVAPRNLTTFGFSEGDTVEYVNGLPISLDELPRISDRFRNDDSVSLGIRRAGNLVYIHYTLYD